MPHKVGRMKFFLTKMYHRTLCYIKCISWYLLLFQQLFLYMSLIFSAFQSNKAVSFLNVCHSIVKIDEFAVDSKNHLSNIMWHDTRQKVVSVITPFVMSQSLLYGATISTIRAFIPTRWWKQPRHCCYCYCCCSFAFFMLFLFFWLGEGRGGVELLTVLRLNF